MTPLRTFGRTDLQIPTVSLGTWAYGGAARIGARDAGWSGHNDDDARAALTAAAAQGISHWDTADVYGNGRSETLIGEVLASGAVSRDDIVLASKVGWDPGSYEHFYHPTLVRERIDASLNRLGTDHIDIYYLHHCDFGPGDSWLDPAMEVLQAAQAAGKIRFIGLSDWSAHKIMTVAPRIDPDVIQPYHNVSSQDFETSGLAAYCEENRCGVAFFSPIRHGLLLGKYGTPTTFPEGDFRNNDSAFKDAAMLQRLVANRDALDARFGHRCSEPVLGGLLGALTHATPNSCVLLGQRNLAQVNAAANAATLELSDDEVTWVRELYR